MKNLFVCLCIGLSIATNASALSKARLVSTGRLVDTLNEISETKETNKIKKHALSKTGRPTLGSDVLDYLKKHKVYVSLTTSPTRAKLVHHVLDTLDLSLVTKIYLNIPLRFGRDNSEYKIPFKLRERYSGKILFGRPPVDLGPITKLLPAVQYIHELGDPDAILIIIDDDTAYPRGMISEMIAAIVRNPNTVIAGSAQDLPFWGIDPELFPRSTRSMASYTPTDQEDAQAEGPRKCQANPQDGQSGKQKELKPHDIVEGFGGVGFKVSYVDVDLMKKLSNRKFSKECYVSDDIVVSFALALSGVQRLKLENAFFGLPLIHQFPYGFKEDALHRGAGLESDRQTLKEMNEGKYKNCINDLIKLTRDEASSTFKQPSQIKSEWNELYLD